MYPDQLASKKPAASCSRSLFFKSGYTVKPVLSDHSKRLKIGFQDRLLFNAGRTYCRMLQREHSAIHSTCIKLPSVFKTFVLSIFEQPLKTGFTVCRFRGEASCHEDVKVLFLKILSFTIC